MVKAAERSGKRRGERSGRAAARIAVACGVALGIGLAAGPAASEDDTPPGREAFVQYCAACHGMEGGGDGPAGEALKKKPADLRRIAARRGGTFPEAAVLRMIDGRDPILSHGSREMPVWGTVFRGEVPPGPAGEAVARGKALLLVQYLASIQAEE